jgi:hypothetical protein
MKDLALCFVSLLSGLQAVYGVAVRRSTKRAIDSGVDRENVKRKMQQRREKCESKRDV